MTALTVVKRAAFLGLAIPFVWILLWHFFESAIFEQHPRLFSGLRYFQFITWPSSFPGVNPFVDSFGRHFFVALIIFINAALYAGLGYIYWRSFRR